MNQEQMVQRPANLGLNVICLVTVVCIVLKSIYSNLFLSVLRFLVEIAYLMYSILARLEAGLILNFLETRVLHGKTNCYWYCFSVSEVQS